MVSSNYQWNRLQVLPLWCIILCITSITSTNGLISPHEKKQYSNRYPKTIDTSLIEIGSMIGDGAFGKVHWGWMMEEEERELVVIKEAKEDIKNAVGYLDTEAYLNRRLCVRNNNNNNLGIPHHPNIAPYLGECKKNGRRYLVWKASGIDTLEDVIRKTNPKDMCIRLGESLKIPFGDGENVHQFHSLAREILLQLLSGLSYCHAKGIVHRDIKPANILVDESNASLRLIDFGSAADMASFTDRRGYRGKNKGVRNLLYCAPEEFVEEDHPYAFDVYSVAICWLRIIVPGLQSSEDDFFQFRTDLRDCHHDLHIWNDICLMNKNEQKKDRSAASSSSSSTLLSSERIISYPMGWEDIFHTLEGKAAFDVLCKMMTYKPENRRSASEILLEPYLNPTCKEPIRPFPPASPWSLTSHLEHLIAEQSLFHRDECIIPDWYFDEIIFANDLNDDADLGILP